VVGLERRAVRQSDCFMGSRRADAGVADHNQSTCGEIAGDLFEVRENDRGGESAPLVRGAGAG